MTVTRELNSLIRAWVSRSCPGQWHSYFDLSDLKSQS